MWTNEVAEFVAEAPTDSAPDDVKALALQPIVDTVGCMVAGLASPAGVAVHNYAGLGPETGLVDLWGTRRQQVGIEQLALVGGTLGHALDFDDVSGYGHPSAILLSTILSIDDGPTLDGATVLDAYLIGYEVSVKIGKMLGQPHYRHGWHITSTAGTFAATAAAARLYRLDTSRTRHALGIAASMMSGIRRNFGTMTKPLHSGLAARNGVAAARLAASGLTAAGDVLGGPRGVVDMYSLGTGDPSHSSTLGKPWSMQERIPSLKKYPSCFSTHRVIDAALQIQKEHEFSADDIKQLVVRAPTISLTPLIYHRPKNGLEGKFSAHYVVAAAFIDRAVTVGSFDDPAVLRPEIGQLIDVMDVQEDPRCRPEDPTGANSSAGTGGFWEVTVHANDGATVTTSCEYAPGSPQRPLEWNEVKDKFLGCVDAAGYDLGAAGTVFERLRRLEAISDLRATIDELGARAS